MRFRESARRRLKTALTSLGLERLLETGDYLIIGDGSGSSWSKPCGWASIVVNLKNGERYIRGGSASNGTSNFAEIMAYVQPLQELAAAEAKRREQFHSHRLLKVHVVTDSEYVVKNGNAPAGLPIANSLLWLLIQDCKKQGVIVDFHWARRAELALNSYADEVSRKLRLLFPADLREVDEILASVPLVWCNPL